MALAGLLLITGMTIWLGILSRAEIQGSPSRKELRQLHQLVRHYRWVRIREAIAKRDFRYLRAVIRESASHTTLHGTGYDAEKCGRYGIIRADGLFDKMSYTYFIDRRTNAWTFAGPVYGFPRPIR